MTPQRKPDYVFNVLGSGRLEMTVYSPRVPAHEWRDYNKSVQNVASRIQYRIRVHMKPAKNKTQGQMLSDFSEAVIAKRAEEKANFPKISESSHGYRFEANGPVYAVPEGFIRHDGGPCPVAKGVLIEAVFRDGETGKARSNVLHWGHYCRVNDIIAYRPERSPDFRVEAGRFYITAKGERVGPMAGSVYKWISGRVGNLDPEWQNNGSRLSNTDSDLIALAADQTSPMVDEFSRK